MHTEELASHFKLVHGVEDLILREKRSPEEVEALNRALQLFKEGRLEGAVSKGLPPDADLEKIFSFFDQPIESVGLIDEAVALLREHGIRLVGEILRFKWQYRFKGGENVHQLFLRRHIPVSTDPWSLGWRPAYLKDQAVLDALMLPGTLLFSDLNVWDPHPLRQMERLDNVVREWTTPYVGQSIAKKSKANWQLEQRDVVELQKMLDRVPALASTLHASMHLPEDFADGRGMDTVPTMVAYREREARATKLLMEECRNSWEPMEIRQLRPVWGPTKGEAEAERRRRSRALAAALKAEGMSPHFFAVATRLNRCYLNAVTTVREFLSKTPGELGYGWESGRDVPDHLAAWGLKFGMTKEELDDLFGPDLSSEAVAKDETESTAGPATA